MTFQQAVELMVQGKLVRRKGWEYKDIAVSINEKLSSWSRFIFRNYRGGELKWIKDYYISYHPTVEDVIADDWEVVE